MNESQLSSCLTDTPPPLKRPRVDSSTTSVNDDEQPVIDLTDFCPEKMQLVSVLCNNLRSKRIVLHTRFVSDPTKDGIVILEKSPFPADPQQLKTNKVVQQLSTEKCVELNTDAEYVPTIDFPTWNAQSLLSNDVYHRLLVTAGFELVNGVNMTVIYPAKDHHFKRYGAAGRRIFHESPDVYQDVIVPFLAQKPRDLSWVDNILNDTAEADRVLYTDENASSGYTLVLDYRWNGKSIQEMHCLALVRDPQLACLRDLRASHLPMLKAILDNGRKILAKRYNSADKLPGLVEEDQIMAYLHYPPTFYRLHVHFVHVDTGDDGGTRAGRAHLLEEVIQNLELNGSYYANRLMTLYLHSDSPMLGAIESHLDKKNSVNNMTNLSETEAD